MREACNIDYQEMIKESLMLKHYCDKHEEKDLEKMKFHMKILKTPRSYFIRQSSESALIQTHKEKHLILNLE